MTDKKWRVLLIALSIIILVIVSVVVMPQFRAGVRVTIKNTGTTPLKSIAVLVTGASYELGDIASGDSATVRVKAASESDLEIEFIDSHGQSKRLNVDAYLEAGYRGTIRVSIMDGKIDKNEQDIRLW